MNKGTDLMQKKNSGEGFLGVKCAREGRGLGHHMRCNGVVEWYLGSSGLDLARAKSGFGAMWRPWG